jgi:hypothetical protein
VTAYFFGNEIPKCRCDCGRSVKWHKTQCRYNDYVTGHNENRNIFSANNQPTFTPAQIKARNDSIREAYGDPALKKKISQGVKEALDTPEYREFAREHCIRLQEQGKVGPGAQFKTEWVHNPFTGNEEYMHSSWESRFLQECIEKEQPVTKAHGIRIPYTKPNGKEGFYIPDFKHVYKPILYEIKGRVMPLDGVKMRAGRDWCGNSRWCYEVVTYSPRSEERVFEELEHGS